MNAEMMTQGQAVVQPPQAGAVLTPPHVSHALVATVAGAAGVALLGALAVGALDITGATDHLTSSYYDPTTGTGAAVNVVKGALALSPDELANHGIMLKPDVPTMWDKIVTFLSSHDAALKDVPAAEAQKMVEQMHVMRMPDGSWVQGLTVEDLKKTVEALSKDNPTLAAWFAENNSRLTDVYMERDVTEQVKAAAATAKGAAQAVTLPKVEADNVMKFVHDNGAKLNLTTLSAQDVADMRNVSSQHVLIDGKSYNLTVDKNTYNPVEFMKALHKIDGFDVKGSVSMLDGAKWGALIGGAKVGMQSLGEHREMEQQFAQAQQMSWQQRIGAQQQAATALLQARAAREAQDWATRTTAASGQSVSCPTV